MPKSWFSYNGLSCEKWNCYKTQPINFPTPVRNVKKISVPGRNGDIVIDEGSYNNLTVTVECYIDGPFIRLFDAMRAALMADPDYHVLTDSLYPNEYRMARVTDVKAKITTPTAGSAQIELDVKPQRFLTADNATKTFIGATAPETGHKLTDFATTAQGSLSALAELFGYSTTDVANMEFIVWNISGIMAAGDFAQIVRGSDDPFFGLVSDENPLTASALISSPLYGSGEWKVAAWNNYVAMPRLFNMRLFANGNEIKSDPSFAIGKLYNMTHSAAKPIIKFTPVGSFSGYVGGINDCGIYIDTNDATARRGIITIDAETMDAYSLPDENELGQLLNINPFISFSKSAFNLMPGDNAILSNNLIDGLTITPNWWTV